MTARPDSRSDDADYELIDFGDGRKLESLAGYLIDRPSPAALDSRRAKPQSWQNADAVFDEATKRWHFYRPWPVDLYVHGTGFRLPLRPTPFGHIGVFPEQRENWSWLASTLKSFVASSDSAMAESEPVQALNLFAHTGGSSLAMAVAGAAVVHLDAAKPNVMAAKEAAVASGLGSMPIRYIVDDAAKFTAREVRRKRRYDMIVLDPPAYGHSPEGKAWRIDRDLWPLMDDALCLLNPKQCAMLITGHSAALDPAAILDYLRAHSLSKRASVSLQSGRSVLKDRSQRKLDAGFYVRAIWIIKA